MVISRFTRPELDEIHRLGNLTSDESKLLELRAEERSLEWCAEELNVSVSTINRISKRLNNKIEKIM